MSDAPLQTDAHPLGEIGGLLGGPRRAAVIGLLGGIASGKSLVATQLRELGAAVLDADRAGHEVLRLPEVEEAVRRRWGSRVFDPDGHVDRRALGQIVFGGEDKRPAEAAAEPNGDLAYLEELTHPRIGRLVAQQAVELAQRGAPAIVLDAPLLLKAGWHSFCDKILFVDAPRDMRLARARSRGWTEEEFERRENAQEPLDVKRAYADVIIDNSTSPDSARVQVERFWHSLIG